jgi:predicted transcriptional regulator
MMKSTEGIQITFRPSRSGLKMFWGELEAKLLEIIWANNPITVKRVRYFACKDGSYAYTTIMTVMNRLVVKGILTRTKKSHSFSYSPVMPREQFLDYAIDKVLSGLFKDFGNVTSRALKKVKKPARKRK